MDANWSSASGRVWPGHTMGICRDALVFVDVVGDTVDDDAVVAIVEMLIVCCTVCIT